MLRLHASSVASPRLRRECSRPRVRRSSFCQIHFVSFHSHLLSSSSFHHPHMRCCNFSFGWTNRKATSKTTITTTTLGIVLLGLFLDTTATAVCALQSPINPKTTSTSSSTMKASVNMALSVDGFIATKDGGVDWLNEQPIIEGEDMGFSDFLNSIDVIVMGRNSFDKVVSFGKDLYGYGDKKLVVWTRDVTKVVIPDYLQDKKVIASSKDPQALLNELSSQGYNHAYVDGGTTIQRFLQAKLIHRMSLTRIPILLGNGIPLFRSDNDGDGDGGSTTTGYGLKHVSTKSYENGMVQSIYDVNYSAPLSEDGTIQK